MRGQLSILEPPLAVAAGPRFSKIILVAVALLYGVLLLFLPLNSPADIYNSPDEFANKFFAQGIADDGRLARPVTHPNLPESVTPRSLLRSGNTYLPVGFVSFPVLLGILIKGVGFLGATAVLAALSVLALLCWYGFLRSVFGSSIALVSALLTATHPFVLYWGERPLLPNAWFLAFVFFALYFIARAVSTRQDSLPQDIQVQLERPTVRQPKARRYAYSALGGLTLGLAIVLRPQEGIWLAAVPLYMLATPYLRKKISLMIFAVLAFIPIGALLLLQSNLYGSPIRTGYHLTPLNKDVLGILRNLVTPFGIDIEQIRFVMYNYWLAMIWWFALLIFVALILAAVRKDGHLLKRFRLWILGTAVVALWLILFYGSFAVQDRIDRLSSIGTSFTRYFLPFYVLGLPLAAYALFRLRARVGRLLTSGIVAVGVIVSLRAVFWATDESVIRIPEALVQNQEIQARALEVLPEDAVVLTDRSDKIFFPEREVVTRFRSFHQPDFEELYGLSLYYETIADKQVVDFENEFYWGPHHLRASDPVDLGYRHILYKLELLPIDDIMTKPE